MNNISKVNSNQLRDVLSVVEQCCRQLQIDFYIVGALAKEIWFAAEGIVTGGTKDVDLASFVSDEHQFDQLKSALIDNHGFRQAKENSFALFAPNGTQIDILPFGSVEVEDGIAVKGQDLKKIKINGFKEVYSASLQDVKVLNEKSYKIATLPGIILLKLIAFDDRPEHRGKDLLSRRLMCFSRISIQGQKTHRSSYTTYSTSRGILMSRFQGTVMKDFILSVVDPNTLWNKQRQQQTEAT